jgi:hypothetical protein
MLCSSFEERRLIAALYCGRSFKNIDSGWLDDLLKRQVRENICKVMKQLYENNSHVTTTSSFMPLIKIFLQLLRGFVR